MSAVLGLDLGTATGWAMRRDDRANLSGVLDCAPIADNQPGSRFRLLKEHLSWCLEAADGALALVAYEKVTFIARNHGARAVQMWGGFEAVLLMWCEHRDIACLGVPVQTIKKHVTGRGNGTKTDILENLRRCGFDPTDHNEADAIGVMAYACAQLHRHHPDQYPPPPAVRPDLFNQPQPMET
jgi:Holliday junction resolvasome RuvABC endonuclease subunit